MHANLVTRLLDLGRALLRGSRPWAWVAAIAVLGGWLVVSLKADVTWNFVAVALGMAAFGLFALPSLLSHSSYE